MEPLHSLRSYLHSDARQNQGMISPKEPISLNVIFILHYICLSTNFVFHASS